MNSKVLLICLMLTGCALADPDSESPATPDPAENPATPDGTEEATTPEVSITPPSDDVTKDSPPPTEEKNENVSPAEPSAGSDETTTPAAETSSDDTAASADPTPSGETPPNAPEEAAANAGKLGDLLHTAGGDNTENKSGDVNAPVVPADLPREPKTSGEETGPLPKVEVPVNDVHKVKTPAGEDSPKVKDAGAPRLAIVGTNKPGSGVSPHRGDAVPQATPKLPADHKMTPTEQKAYVCNLPTAEEDLCPMTINLEERMAIADPGANAYCNDVIAAPMGYHGRCVVLSKTNPETGDPIYTRTCAFYDKEKSKCSTTFLTTQPQTNSTQVKYTCPNGIIHYVPTSCVKKQNQIVLH